MQRSPFRYPVSFHRRTAGIIALGVALGMTIFVILSFARSQITQSSGELAGHFVYSLLIPVVVVLTWRLNIRFNRASPEQWGLLKHRPALNFFSGLAIGIAASLAITALAASLLQDVRIEFDLSLNRPLPELASLFMFTLTTGIWEEHIFRGFVFVTLLRRGSGLVGAALISSAVFTAPHVFLGNPDALPLSLAAVFSLGILVAYGYALTGSLWLAAGLHFAWNLSVEIIRYRDLGPVTVPNYAAIRGELEAVETACLLIVAGLATAWLLRTSGRVPIALGIMQTESEPAQPRGL